MLFSIMPPEDVWSPRQPDDTEGRWIPLPRGRLVCVCAGPEGYRVARLVSPEPRDYLDPALQPGAPWPFDGRPRPQGH